MQGDEKSSYAADREPSQYGDSGPSTSPSYTTSKHMLNNGGKIIRAFRGIKSMSQAELAARAGLSRGYIGNIETGKRSPSYEMLTRIADALGKPVGLFTGELTSPGNATDEIFSHLTIEGVPSEIVKILINQSSVPCQEDALREIMKNY